jgi:hypothetical protein
MGLFCGDSAPLGSEKCGMYGYMTMKFAVGNRNSGNINYSSGKNNCWALNGYCLNGTYQLCEKIREHCGRTSENRGPDF